MAVLFLLFGSSAAGKTFALSALRERMPELAIHDFDEIGVPAKADTAWRQRSNELWVRRALDYESQGIDLLLAGQTPFGELLAAPSAPFIEAISACLVDCNNDTRVARLNERGTEWLTSTGADIGDFLEWAEWMRHHARDPSWCPQVIRQADSGDLRWERWSDWQAGDARWRVQIIDTSALSVEQVADELSGWIERERDLARTGTHPLTHWADKPST